MKRLIFCLAAMCLTLNITAQKISNPYSFFVAGHVYGDPNNPHFGLHYPFVDYFPNIQNYPGMEFGVLTGDVAYQSTAEYWDAAQSDIDLLNMPVYIAAGNHDMSGEFVNRFGDYYFSYIQNSDLFIILTPGLGVWNITGDQLQFLENTLEDSAPEVNNIFIFLHELIWWSPDNKYQEVHINYEPHYPGATNFESVIQPLLLSYPNNITIYAGDLGATASASPFMYHHFNNITLIGSGMGHGLEDNIVVTEVYEDSIYYNLIALNGNDPKALGELKDFTIYSSINAIGIEIPKIYPNPCKESFTVVNTSHSELKMSILDISGRRVLAQLIPANTEQIINTTELLKGVYILQTISEGKLVKQKLIIQ